MNTYWNYYEKYFAPKIREIDLFLKTESTKTISSTDVERLLSITEEEIDQILEANHLDELNLLTFFVLMQNGSSPVCKLFSREVQRKMPHFYSFYDISYIYQIPYEHVVDGAQKANITHITSANIHLLFEKIELKMPHYSL